MVTKLECLEKVLCHKIITNVIQRRDGIWYELKMIYGFDHIRFRDKFIKFNIVKLLNPTSFWWGSHCLIFAITDEFDAYDCHSDIFDKAVCCVEELKKMDTNKIGLSILDNMDTDYHNVDVQIVMDNVDLFLEALHEHFAIYNGL